MKPGKKIEKKCTVCNERSVDPDHIKTRGSGGSDDNYNLWPLCRKHHDEKGKSLKRFCDHYPVAHEELRKRGWEVVKEFGQWKLRRV